MDVTRMQAALTRHLLVAGLVLLALGFAVRQPAWGASAALGCAASAAYFVLLRRQVVKTLDAGRQPDVVGVVVALIGRQAVCLLACLVALKAWGVAWWACLAAILLARHAVMLVARPEPLRPLP